MSKHSKSRRRAVAITAVAGSAIGFGVLAALATPTAGADIQGGDGWWLFSGTAAAIGNNGNGNTNQFGGGNGNIINGQLNVPILSPVIAGGNAINAAPALGGLAVGGLGASTATNLDLPVGGSALSTALGLNPAVALGGIGGSNLGASLGGIGLGNGWGLGGLNVPVATGGVGDPGERRCRHGHRPRPAAVPEQALAIRPSVAVGTSPVAGPTVAP